MGTTANAVLARSGEAQASQVETNRHTVRRKATNLRKDTSIEAQSHRGFGPMMEGVLRAAAVSLSGLDGDEIFILGKLERQQGRPLSAWDVLNIPPGLDTQAGFGEKAARGGAKLLTRVRRDAELLSARLQNAPAVENEEELYSGPPRQLVAGRRLDIFESSILPDGVLAGEPDAVGLVLVEDLRRWLAGAKKIHARTLRGRSGFEGLEEKLQTLGQSFGLTRERMRQIEVKARNAFARSLRVTSRSLAAWMAGLDAPGLLSRFPAARAAFASDRHFLRFLETCAALDAEVLVGQHLGSGAISNRVLDELFAVTPKPVTVGSCVAWLRDKVELSESAAYSQLARLARQGVVTIEGNHVRPRRLTHFVAVAHVLRGHPGGLDWLDVVHRVNNEGLTTRPMSEDRLSHAFDSRWVWQSGRGWYRHRVFIEVVEAARRPMLEKLRALLEESGGTANLLELGSPGGVSHEGYWAARHLARAFGHEVGITFVGRGRADTVSLEPSAVHRTLVDILVSVVDGPEPVSFDDLRHCIERSEAHLKQLLRLAIDSGRVVPVAEGMWWTVSRVADEEALSRFDATVEALLEEDPRPMTAGLLRDELAARAGLDWNRELVRSLALVRGRKKGWSAAGCVIARKDAQPLARYGQEALASAEHPMTRLSMRVRARRHEMEATIRHLRRGIRDELE